MKMKITIVLIIFLIIVVLSYFIMSKREMNYTILGEKEIFSNNLVSKNFSDLIYEKLSTEKNFGFYSKEFIKDDIRIIDLINIIKDNQKSDNLSIQNILNRTNILILNIGNSEIYYKLSKLDIEENNDKIVYRYLDEITKDMVKLLKEIKKYNNSDIYVLGYYNNTNNMNNDKYYKYINNLMNNYCENNNIYFIDTYEILNKNIDYLSQNMPIYITNEGNIALFNKIYSKIAKLYLHKQL